MNLLERFMSSTKNLVAKARQIPRQSVNVFDQTNAVQTQFEPFQKTGETSFTPAALAELDKEIANMTEPVNGFTRLEQDITLGRWNYKNKYYKAGQAPSK